MAETIRWEDMRLFAALARATSFTSAARKLGVPKQTLSRRVADLERALGVELLHRTTRKLQLTRIGEVYAERCAEIGRIADEANRAAADAQRAPAGTLRITADPVFGEAFLGDLLIEYARTWPDVRLELSLTRRRVDLVEEGFDVAFRVGHVDDASLGGFRLGPARVRYCASPAYVARRGAPATPDDLAQHDCLVVSDGAEMRWPFRGEAGPRAVPVSGRIVSTSFTLARAAALAGLGIAIFPAFACADDLANGRLVSVLDDWTIEVGAVWLVHPTRRSVPARVRVFAELARARLAGTELTPAPAAERATRARRPGARPERAAPRR